MNYRPTVDEAAAAAVFAEAHIGHSHGIASRASHSFHTDHRSRSPNLFEFGCLAATAVLAGLLDKDRAAFFTKYLEAAHRFRGFGEMAGSRGASLRGDAGSQTPNENMSALLGVLGIVVALL